jgi:hypothetical protein
MLAISIFLCFATNKTTARFNRGIPMSGLEGKLLEIQDYWLREARACILE